MKFFEAWKIKGLITKYRSQWSAIVHEGYSSRYIFTIWNNPHGTDTEIFFKKGWECPRLDVPPGDWAYTKPGRDYIERAKACQRFKIMGEIILIEGDRQSRPSKATSADIRDNMYWIEFTTVNDNGEMRGNIWPTEV
jgi:hypothetical protein